MQTEDATMHWVLTALELEVPDPEVLVIKYSEHRVVLGMFREPEWELVDESHDPGGKYTGRSAKYNQPRTTVTFVSRNSAPDGKFIQVKVRYGKNGPTNLAWLFCKKVE